MTDTQAQGGFAGNPAAALDTRVRHERLLRQPGPDHPHPARPGPVRRGRRLAVLRRDRRGDRGGRLLRNIGEG